MADPTSPIPLMLVFHGATQGAAGMELMSWLYPAADAAGVLVAYPEAAGDYWNTPNSPPAYWGVPDVAFADAIVEDVALRHGIDRDRVFAAGFSNGAIFAQILACLRGESIAAVGVVGAGVSANVSSTCPWSRPVPAVVFFGDADPQFFWDEGLAAGVGMLGGSGSAAWLADRNGCAPEPAVLDLGDDPDSATGAEVWHYRDCTAGADVDFYRIRRGGHTWPGSPMNLGPGFGLKNRAIDASSLMVDFFLAHPLTPGGGS